MGGARKGKPITDQAGEGARAGSQSGEADVSGLGFIFSEKRKI